MLKYKLKLKDVKLEDFRVYLLALFKGILPKKKIKNNQDLKNFIQEKSAWVSQVTLYNYLKTRMGTKWVLHFYYLSEWLWFSPVITNERGIQCQKMNNTGKKPEVCYSLL